MANIRSLVIDGLVNPAVMPGFKLITGSVTVDTGQAVTVTLAGVTSVLCAFGIVGTTCAAMANSISKGVATLTTTTAATGDLQYFIVASATEDIDITDAGTGAIAITPTL